MLHLLIRMFLIETYSVTDCIFCSNGNLTVSSNGQVIINSDGSYTLSPVNNNNYGFVYYSRSDVGSSSWIYLNEGDTLEFEILDKVGTVGLRFDGTGANNNIWTINRTSGKIKITHNGSSVNIYLNGTLYVSPSITSESKQPRFRIEAGSSITIQNLLHY